MKLRNKKTGKCGILTLNNSEGEVEIVVLEPDIALCGYSVLARYDSVVKLSEEWEDYKPKEPLIKDEKIRKAVRAWAEANNITDIRHCINMRWLSNEEESSLISFDNDEIAWLEDTHYTITELCGEEEE